MSRVFLLALTSALFAAPQASSWTGGDHLDAVLEAAVGKGEIPGAVVLVGQDDRILHHKAYGSQSLVPQREPMRLDTIFDCASLTKVVATTPAILTLVEEGKLRLGDRVTAYLPKFREGSSPITVKQLLTHYSGLRPDVDLAPAWSGYETGVNLAYREVPIAQPDEKFIYSDINYILLAEIVRQITGKRIDEYAAERIFIPLGMRESGYLPDASLSPRIAPTERLPGGEMLRGVVHDPTTRMMGGVAGHAGLFSTATDLGRFARMLLGKGTFEGVRVLSPLAVRAMSTPQSPDGLAERALGFDLDSPYASPRGDLYPKGSFGHTGFTGTSMWVDPATRSYVILMTNRVHPDGRGSVVSLRSRVASVVAGGFSVEEIEGEVAAKPVPAPASAAATEVLTGLDVLARDGFAPLRGKHVGLITNHTGVDRRGRPNTELFRQAPGVTLSAVFAPEHGFEGRLDQETIGDSETHSGIRVYSLYQGDRRRPTPAMLAGLDALVFDIQDVGVRFYTYITTMAYAMEEAAKAGVPFYVLDRPNPIRGDIVEGPLLDDALRSFIGYHELPVRHGMTIGELARMFNAERSIGADLHVVEMEGWRRSMWFDETGQPWINPSPNIRTLDQALLYPGVALLEGLRNYSVGRGTDAPFEFVGADWMDGARVAADLRAQGIDGAGFYAVQRQPESSYFADQTIDGVQLVVTDRDRLSSLRLGLALASTLTRLYGDRLNLAQTEKLIGSLSTIEALRAGRSQQEIWEAWQGEIERFEARRSGFLIY